MLALLKLDGAGAKGAQRLKNLPDHASEEAPLRNAGEDKPQQQGGLVSNAVSTVSAYLPGGTK